MLQQTRVAAVVPYYERFLERFPNAEALAEAPEPDLLQLWSGLGYYSRARNLQKAARQIVEGRGFPATHDAIRELAGVGDYTAAAVASLAFGLPHAAVDGNVLRVTSRLLNDAGDIGSGKVRKRLTAAAERLLDRRRAGLFNQAMMELGATLCLPKTPRCPECPIAQYCGAFDAGTQNQLPLKLRRGDVHRIERTVLVIKRRDRILMRQRPAEAAKLAGFWELPEPGDVPEAQLAGVRGRFRHSITNHNYRISVVGAELKRKPRGFAWVVLGDLGKLPLSTTARKALAIDRAFTETK